MQRNRLLRWFAKNPHPINPHLVAEAEEIAIIARSHRITKADVVFLRNELVGERNAAARIYIESPSHSLAEAQFKGERDGIDRAITKLNLLINNTYPTEIEVRP